MVIGGSWRMLVILFLKGSQDKIAMLFHNNNDANNNIFHNTIF